MGAVEILWMVHSDNLNSLVENRKSQVRQYLTATRDYDTLRWWDTQSLTER